MAIYARAYEGVVVEIIQPSVYPSDSPEGIYPGWKAGDYIPIEDRYTAEFVAGLIDITAIQPTPEIGWSATDTSDGWVFNPPASSS